MIGGNFITELKFRVQVGGSRVRRKKKEKMITPRPGRGKRRRQGRRGSRSKDPGANPTPGVPLSESILKFLVFSFCGWQ